MTSTLITTLVDNKPPTVEELLVDRHRLLVVLEDAIDDAKYQASDPDNDACCDEGEECEDHVRGAQLSLAYAAAHAALLKILEADALQPIVVDEMQIGDFQIQILSDGSLLRQPMTQKEVLCRS